MFNPRSLEESKQMTVGDCNGISAARRWEVETPIFGDIILEQSAKSIAQRAASETESLITLLDFGCGSGRLAKYLLEKNRKIKIIGVDKSPEMLQVAKNYVLSDRFETMQLNDFLKCNLKFDFGYCVYVLQHIPAIELRDIIRVIHNVCAKILLVNSVIRMAVKGDGFDQGDGVNVLDEVRRFYSHFEGALPWQVIMDDPVIRKMFCDGNTLHYAVVCS